MANASFFLVLRKTQRHPYMGASIHNKLPKLAPGEVVVTLRVDIPDALFSRPQLTAKITVPSDKAPPIITAEVQHDIARVLSERIGLTVNVTADGED